MSKAIVLRTAGTNCDYETVYALSKVGFEVELVHINQFIRKEKNLSDFNLLVIPGGFSAGDYLGSAKVMANKLAYRLKEEVLEFIDSGNLVLGICNGFQALVKAGLLPAFDGKREQSLTLTFNDSGHFQDEWIELKNANKGKCIFSRGIEVIHCPINHGEGKFDPGNEKNLQRLYDNDQVVFKYVRNPNGSIDNIAGICDETGLVFGLMPHPEKNHSLYYDPHSLRDDSITDGEGLKIFKNAFDYLNK